MQTAPRPAWLPWRASPDSRQFWRSHLARDWTFTQIRDQLRRECPAFIFVDLQDERKGLARVLERLLHHVPLRDELGKRWAGDGVPAFCLRFQAERKSIGAAPVVACQSALSTVTTPAARGRALTESERLPPVV
jgi:hypothetical protein